MAFWKSWDADAGDDGFEIGSYFKNEAGETVYPNIVLGGGIGALNSSLYLARAGMNPLIIEGQMQGGLLTQSHSVQNWP